MGAMLRMYLRCDDPPALARVKQRFPTAIIEPPSVFASVDVTLEERIAPAELDRLSAELNTEIIYLAFFSVSDSLEFTRSVRGQTVRHLQYGMAEQGQWEAVVGSAEEWEVQAFFATNILAEVAPNDPDAQRVAEIYAQRILTRGEIWPMIDARESARVAAVHYRLTDWLDDWHGTSAQESLAAGAVATGPVTAPKQNSKPWWRFW